jgi:hypothetical protein
MHSSVYRCDNRVHTYSCEALNITIPVPSTIQFVSHLLIYMLSYHPIRIPLRSGWRSSPQSGQYHSIDNPTRYVGKDWGGEVYRHAQRPEAT